MPRTSILIRLSHEDAARIRKGAAAEYRSLSGYLLYVLERSCQIEDKVVVGKMSGSLLAKQARATIGWQDRKNRTAIHLRCTVEQAARIREYAAKRQLSIGDFVVFSFRRLWIAVARLHG